MIKLIAALLTSAVVLSLISVLTRSAPPVALLEQTCYCTASDGSCSVSITCNGACQRYCGTQGDCWAECSGFYESLTTETTFEMQNGTYPQMVAELARISGKDISFSPTKPDTTFNIGFSQATLWDALEFLSERGTVRIAGKDFDSLRRLRKVLLSGQRISFGVKNTPVSTLVNDLAGLTGLPLRVSAGRPTAKANVELQDANLNDILARVSEQTGTKIIEEGSIASAP